MRADRIAAALIAVMAGCTRPTPPAATAVSTPNMCRVGPDGGPDIADRGIGGTGAPVREADRGIGGTGGPALAESGIGGTGIVAVITGFASVCLAGQEVALPPGAAVTIGDQPASPAALRAGQVAIVEASGSGTELAARRVMIRIEVAGPVQAATGDRLVVAGQDVAISPATWGGRPGVGDWAVVSGLRRPDGVIEATRLDARGTGEVVVHGKLLDDAGRLQIGGLAIRQAPGLTPMVGQDVTASGVIDTGTLIPTRIVPDLLASDPAALFGPGIGVFYVETFAVVGGGRVRFGQGFSAEARGLGMGGPGRAVLRLERGGSGLRAVGFGPTGTTPGRFETAPRFEPAPVPNRAIRGPDAGRSRLDGPSGRGGPRQGDGLRPGGVGRGGGGSAPGPGAGPPPGR